MCREGLGKQYMAMRDLYKQLDDLTKLSKRFPVKTKRAQTNEEAEAEAWVCTICLDGVARYETYRSSSGEIIQPPLDNDFGNRTKAYLAQFHCRHRCTSSPPLSSRSRPHRDDSAFGLSRRFTSTSIFLSFMSSED